MAQPVFMMTADVDWASEHCIEYFISRMNHNGIKPVLFSTHYSDALNMHKGLGNIDVGIHPNFGSGSSHGSSIEDVMTHIMKLVPAARIARSHSFYDSTPIVEAFRSLGISHDSNICLFMEPGLSPLNLWNGIKRLPVFWEDDVHWLKLMPWDIDCHRDRFLSSGLKVINVHPFNYALNIHDNEFYLTNKQHIKTITEEARQSMRWDGAGTETFVSELIHAVKAAGINFKTLDQYFDWESLQ